MPRTPSADEMRWANQGAEGRSNLSAMLSSIFVSIRHKVAPAASRRANPTVNTQAPFGDSMISKIAPGVGYPSPSGDPSTRPVIRKPSVLFAPITGRGTNFVCASAQADKQALSTSDSIRGSISLTSPVLTFTHWTDGSLSRIGPPFSRIFSLKNFVSERIPVSRPRFVILRHELHLQSFNRICGVANILPFSPVVP
jgi:hypothetical protein